MSPLAEALGLDYGGINFAPDAQRTIIVFEADATMNVPPAAVERRPYGCAAVEKIERAVRTMLPARGGAAARAC